VRQLSTTVSPSLLIHPFTSSITVSYSVMRDSRTTIAVFDMNGRCVRVLYEGMQKSGNHIIRWDGRLTGGRLAGAGMYLVLLESGSSSVSSKILFVK
jgi:flagellar hook assembly protein FlgD